MDEEEEGVADAEDPREEAAAVQEVEEDEAEADVGGSFSSLRAHAKSFQFFPRFVPALI